MMQTEQKLLFSIIVPVYNRRQELKELLESLVRQTHRDFEVVIVEDGSQDASKDVVEKFDEVLRITYLFKENSGPGLSRNYGMQHASGNYFIILDSDVILPENYMEIVRYELEQNYVDVYGGPDAAAQDFTPTQKAINYAMTSIFTTGGIRGKVQSLEKFHPRSFNMGISKQVFKKTQGFSPMRFGEDIDFSIRIFSEGFKSRLIPSAYVFHKRRNTIRQFFKQVYNSGIARINLYKRHPKSLKTVHFFPAIFTLSLPAMTLIFIFVCKYALLPFFLYFILLFIDASIKNKSILIGAYSALMSFVMLMGYGLGFMQAFWMRILLKRQEFSSFEKTFYK